MKLNIAKLRLAGLVSFVLFLVISFVKFSKNGQEDPAVKWDSKPENLLIAGSVCCFLVVFSMQAWKLVTTYYIKKEDPDPEQ